jgi:HD-GYP domain-containing protein (c-di-GMP phosphodiesterase class II)
MSDSTPSSGWLDKLKAAFKKPANTPAPPADPAVLAYQALTQAYDATLEAWARALEQRKNESGAHLQRVTDLTVELARAIGVTEGEIAHVRRGAMLHDIGEMAIPDSILMKTGRLLPNERAMWHKHPEYAYEILMPVEFLRPALDIPYCHHERWDGTGYPRGLKGDRIPLPARIFAVVDTWDALRSERPYRVAWPEAEAWKYLETHVGTEFDPNVVQAFTQIARH